jgi:hypothetical protein
VAGLSGGPGPDLVEGGARPVSRRTTTAAVLLAALVALLVWRTQRGPDAPPQAAPAPPASSRSVQPAGSPNPLITTSITPPPSRSAGTPVVDADPAQVSARLADWLDTLPGRATRPPTYGRASRRDFRVVHTDGFTGGEDFGARAQVHDARGRWVTVAQGSTLVEPPIDGSGSFLAIKVEQASLTAPRVRTRVYILARSDAHVLASLRVERTRYVAGWLGDRVVLASYEENVSVQLLDWQRATMVLEDLGPRSQVLTDRAGDIGLVDVGGAGGCLSVWRFTPQPRSEDGCPDDQILAMSPDGEWAITHDLRWVRLSDAAWFDVGGRPDGVSARSASFLADGRALVDVSLDGSRVEATLLCVRDGGCRRVPTRIEPLGPR